MNLLIRLVRLLCLGACARRLSLEAEAIRQIQEEVETWGCDLTFQCVGTEPDNTVVKSGSCKCHEDIQPTHFCKGMIKGDSWRSCHFPSTRYYDRIGKNNFFDISEAAPDGHLKGFVDLSEQLQEEVLSGGFRVLSDLDDTLICSGGEFPKGIDSRCEKHHYYEGAAELMYALSLPRKDAWGANAHGVIPFSARPNNRLLRMKKCKGPDLHFRRRICKCKDRFACRRNECDCFGLDTKNAQYGSLGDAVDLMKPAGTYENMGSTKFKNWMALRDSLEVPAVFFGDNGQGDLLAAQRMLVASQDALKTTKSGSLNGRVLAAFIHDVTQECLDQECRNAWAKHSIYMFDGYAEATAIAHRIGLLNYPLKARISFLMKEKQDSMRQLPKPAGDLDSQPVGNDQTH